MDIINNHNYLCTECKASLQRTSLVINLSIMVILCVLIDNEVTLSVNTPDWWPYQRLSLIMCIILYIPFDSVNILYINLTRKKHEQADIDLTFSISFN